MRLKTSKAKQLLFKLLALLAIIGFFVLAIYAAQSLATNEAVQTVVAHFGYIGVALIGIITGLNTILPVPAATLMPIFLAAGLNFYITIVVLAVGTLIADTLGFLLGKVSREVIEKKYPKIFSFFTRLYTERRFLVLPMVAAYAAFVPFPNEAILIPLALAGARLQSLILPLIIGNIIHHYLIAYGVTSGFELIA